MFIAIGHSWLCFNRTILMITGIHVQLLSLQANIPLNKFPLVLPCCMSISKFMQAHLRDITTKFHLKWIGDYREGDIKIIVFPWRIMIKFVLNWRPSWITDTLMIIHVQFEFNQVCGNHLEFHISFITWVFKRTTQGTFSKCNSSFHHVGFEEKKFEISAEQNIFWSWLPSWHFVNWLLVA